jgi:signal transduction histidine kinase
MMTDVRILVVDDSRHIREFVNEALTVREGFVILEAADGAQGLEIALAERPDLVMLDLEMPRLNGFQVVDALRAKDADIPIILITSHGSEAIAVEFFRQGVKDYLSKPFTADEMYAAIERAMKEVRLRRERDALTQHLAAINRELRQRVQEMDILYRVGKSVTSMLSREQLLERILDAIFYVIGAEEATLMLLDEESGQLRTALHRQRVAGEPQQGNHRSAEELAADAAQKGEATMTGAMLSAPLKLGDRVIGVLGLGNRVSEQPFSGHEQQLLLALADYAAIAIENARLYTEVQQADQAKSEFVSFVAHELRTPMTSIRGYADMLLKMDDPLSPPQAQFIHTIRSNVVRMQILVSDLQDISRIESGHLRLELQATALSDVLRDALQATQGQIEARSQKLTLNVVEGLPLVRADPARLTQILINLLSNAHKYTPEGGHIRVRAWREGDFVHCAVSDTGIGMSEEDQARLFTKFFRSENPVAREMPGTGLGLCIVKNLVELQGGEIAVESALNQGTTFAFTVPVAL